MKELYKNIAKHWLGYLSIQVIGKLLFLVYQYIHQNKLSNTEIIKALFFGLKHDIAIASYLIVPVVLFILIKLFYDFNLVKIAKIYSYFAVFLIVSIFTVDFEMFRAWGFHIDNSFIKYLNSPKEMLGSVSSGPLLLPIFFGILLVLFGFYIFNKIIFDKSYFEVKQKWLSFISLILFLGLLIVPIRGGLQLAPLNQSSVYFSSNPFANQVATNPVFNLFHSLGKLKMTQNPFAFFDTKTANKHFEGLFTNNGNAPQLLKFTDKPNVLIITWESFTAKVIGKKVQGKAIVPHFENWAKQGIFFNNCFATGDRSEKGIIGILSGYPAQPIASIMTEPSKTAKLPSITKTLKSNGYNTAWYYGGEPEFANIKSYILNSGFEKMVTKSEFKDAETQNSKWGANDHKVFNRLLLDLNQQKQPFFINYFTLSSHEPYEIGNYNEIKGNSETEKFQNSLNYTDNELNNFLLQAQKQAWWNNTLVIIVADHGHRLPEIGDKKDAFHIPMLWLGGVVQQPKIINQVTSQIDIAAILMAQLGYKNDFPFSKNTLCSQNKKWAYGAFNNGFVWVDSSGYNIHDNVGKQFIVKKSTDSLSSRAFLQRSFQDYLSK